MTRLWHWPLVRCDREQTCYAYRQIAQEPFRPFLATTEHSLIIMPEQDAPYVILPDPPWIVTPTTPNHTLQWRMLNEDGREIWLNSGSYDLQVRAVYEGDTGTWSDPRVIELPEPGLGILLVAGLIGLALLKRLSR